MSEDKVKPRELTHYVTCNPDSTDKTKVYDGLNFPATATWVKENGIKRVQVTFTEIIDWPKTPMRNYFHGVVVKAFQDKLNALSSGATKDGKIPHYNLQQAKDVVMIAIFGQIHVLHHVSTEEMSGYEYWDMINAAEQVYFNEYSEMFDKKDKPKKPTPYDN